MMNRHIFSFIYVDNPDEQCGNLNSFCCTTFSAGFAHQIPIPHADVLLGQTGPALLQGEQ